MLDKKQGYSLSPISQGCSKTYFLLLYRTLPIKKYFQEAFSLALLPSIRFVVLELRSLAPANI